MNVDEESDYEEEEFLIYADFKNQLGPLELNENIAVKIIGLEADPVAEVNGNIFKGTYDYPMGTCVFFEKDLDAAPSDPLFEQSCRQKYKFFAKTNKVINFERIFVEKKEFEATHDRPNIGNNESSPEKGDESRDQNQTKAQSEEVNLQINMSYEEAIKQFQSFDNNA
ncbi:general transcription factor 3C polypeptide 6 [Anastrepha obliqua]|uniref:general transcription factor 3C polypeptide 6 n=1 Tax=Anastrepha obliqua TaxID=95512 RepID=UPI002409EDA0|nr:general transcription factor 3C polypeptide 6 [Anastrepha obliqua]